MANNSGLKKYAALKKRAKAKGIDVPRGTNMVELEALLAGKVARCVTTPTRKPAAKKAPAKRKPAKPAPSRTPTAASSRTRKRRAPSTRGGQGSLFGFD